MFDRSALGGSQSTFNRLNLNGAPCPVWEEEIQVRLSWVCICEEKTPESAKAEPGKNQVRRQTALVPVGSGSASPVRSSRICPRSLPRLRGARDAPLRTTGAIRCPCSQRPRQ